MQLEVDHGKFLQFERLTLLPIQTSMLLTPPSADEDKHSTLLTEKERRWLDAYQ